MASKPKIRPLHDRLIVEVQHRLNIEKNEILADLYIQTLHMLRAKSHH